jgi:DnaJ-class molecular chaperone
MPTLVVCGYCDGSGESFVDTMIGGEHSTVDIPCPECAGRGAVEPPDEEFEDEDEAVAS